MNMLFDMIEEIRDDGLEEEVYAAGEEAEEIMEEGKSTMQKAAEAVKNTATRSTEAVTQAANSLLGNNMDEPINVEGKPFTKSETVKLIARSVGIREKTVTQVLTRLEDVIAAHLKEGIPFSWAGLLKFYVVEKTGTPEREGINPFTKEKTVFKAKPAYKTVRVKPLKKLKEMA